MRTGILIIALIVVVVAGGLFFSAQRTHAPGMQQTTASWTKTGNLVKGNPGLDPTKWYLVYEEPGKPALTQKLSPGNVCVDKGSGLFCDGNSFYSGDRVAISGDLKDGMVVISNITGS